MEDIKTPLSKLDFDLLELPDLLLNLWSCADKLIDYKVCCKYVVWNVERARMLWKNIYQNFKILI